MLEQGAIFQGLLFAFCYHFDVCLVVIYNQSILILPLSKIFLTIPNTENIDLIFKDKNTIEFNETVTLNGIVIETDKATFKKEM